MWKLKSWAIALVMVLVVSGIIMVQSGTLARPQGHTLDTIGNIPMPKVEKPLYIMTPANEIFNIASCYTKDIGFAISSALIPPGAGPLPHVHYYINEFFWSPEGGIELVHSGKQYPDIKEIPSAEVAGRGQVYAIDMEPKQLVYGPKHYIHGFANVTTKTKPITFVWLRDKEAPEFVHKDGGMREYFEAVGIKITDLNNLPPVTDEARAAFVSQAPKYGINQSSYFLQYISAVGEKAPPQIMNMRNDQDLAKVIEVIEAFNKGDKSVNCS